MRFRVRYDPRWTDAVAGGHTYVTLNTTLPTPRALAMLHVGHMAGPHHGVGHMPRTVRAARLHAVVVHMDMDVAHALMGDNRPRAAVSGRAAHHVQGWGPSGIQGWLWGAWWAAARHGPRGPPEDGQGGVAAGHRGRGGNTAVGLVVVLVAGVLA